MRQYEIWGARLPGSAGDRPVLLLSRDDSYAYLNKFIVAEITTRIRGIPVEVALASAEGLPQKSVANCDNLRTVARSWLVRRLGALSKRREREIQRAVGYAFGWEELIQRGEDHGVRSRI